MGMDVNELHVPVRVAQASRDQRVRAVWHTARWCADHQHDAGALRALLDQLGLDAAEAKTAR